MNFKDYLKLMVLKDASDLYLTTGAPPSAKIQGVMTHLEQTKLAPGRVKEIAYEVMNQDQTTAFETAPGDEPGHHRDGHRALSRQHLQAAQ